MSGIESFRAFFALQPDAGARHVLETLLFRLPPQAGRPVVADNLHLTLVFIGSCNGAQLACLHQRASTLSMTPLLIDLDHLGVFDQGRVLWVGPEQTHEGLCHLVLRLREALVPCGYLEDSHRPFRAHVTLSRGMREFPEALEVKPVPWQSSEFVLMVSRQTPSGVRYEVMARYPRDAGMPLSAGASVG